MLPPTIHEIELQAIVKPVRSALPELPPLDLDEIAAPVVRSLICSRSSCFPTLL